MSGERVKDVERSAVVLDIVFFTNTSGKVETVCVIVHKV